MSEQGAAGPGEVDGTPGNYVFMPEGQTWQQQYLGGEEFAALREDEYIKTTADVATLAKSLVHNKGLVGRKGVILPKDDDPADRDRFYTELGRPETPAGYEIQAPADLPKEFPYSPELETGFKQWAHEEGLTAAQAKGIYGKYLKATLDQFKAGQAAFVQKMDEIKGNLLKKWGDKYEENLAAGQQAMKRFAPLGSPALEALDRVMGEDDTLAEFFFNLSQAMGEATLHRGGATQAGTAQDKAAELMRHPAYLDQKHPEHKRVVSEVTEIYQQLNPEIKAE